MKMIFSLFVVQRTRIMAVLTVLLLNPDDDSSR